MICIWEKNSGIDPKLVEYRETGNGTEWQVAWSVEKKKGCLNLKVCSSRCEFNQGHLWQAYSLYALLLHLYPFGVPYSPIWWYLMKSLCVYNSSDASLIWRPLFRHNTLREPSCNFGWINGPSMVGHICKYGASRNKLSVTFSTNACHIGLLSLFEKHFANVSLSFKMLSITKCRLLSNARICNCATSLPLCNINDLA